MLIMYLAVRGVRNNFSDRNKLVETVKRVNNQNVSILPKFLLRGSGGYVTFETLVPCDDTVSPIWLSGDNMISVIRNNLPIIDDDFFELMWNIILGKDRNNSRKRCLLHLKTGSFDINDLKVTKDL